MTSVYLIADIGATNARFCLVKDLQQDGQVLILNSRDFNSASDLILKAIERLNVGQIAGALLAVAGPLNASKEQAVVTNTGHTFSVLNLEEQIGCPVWLENDFVALAYGLPYCLDLCQIGGQENNSTVAGLLGPGTGLGMAMLWVDGVSCRVFPSEGGHANFAPGSHLETEVWAFLANEISHVSWEAVLSGHGLVRLYRAICHVWGTKPMEYQSEDITRIGVNLDEPICHQTLETFFSLLGSVAGDFALTVGAQKAIYIAGGIVPAMSDFAVDSPMRRRFEEKGALANYLKEVPLIIVKDQDPGLTGARHRLASCLQSAPL